MDDNREEDWCSSIVRRELIVTRIVICGESKSLICIYVNLGIHCSEDIISLKKKLYTERNENDTTI